MVQHITVLNASICVCYYLPKSCSSRTRTRVRAWTAMHSSSGRYRCGYFPQRIWPGSRVYSALSSGPSTRYLHTPVSLCTSKTSAQISTRCSIICSTHYSESSVECHGLSQGLTARLMGQWSSKHCPHFHNSRQPTFCRIF